MADDVQRHYDAQADTNNTSRASALAKRSSGVLIKYKKHANAVKRRMVDQYAANASLLVDLGCGRGGDLNKWFSSRIRRVVALDLAAAQLDEAKRRALQDPARHGTHLTWLHGSMIDPNLAAIVQPALTGALADAVAAQFALQYAFGDEATANRVLSCAASLLREGGIFFGVAPDAAPILALLDREDQSAAHGPRRSGTWRWST